jgi:hypothetical protein
MRYIVQETHNHKFRLDCIVFLVRQTDKAHIIDAMLGFRNVASGLFLILSLRISGHKTNGIRISKKTLFFL